MALGGRVAVVLLLFVATWFLLQKTSQVSAVPIKKPLGSFPAVIGPYALSDSLQSSADVIEMLGVDDYIQYNYHSEGRSPVSLYVGFYKSVGVGGGYHSPKNCLPGGGWGIDTVREVALDAGIEGGSTAKVTEMLIRNGDRYQVVYYWYQNRGRIIASEYWEKIYLVLDAIFKRRRDGTFVRIIAPVAGGDIQATERDVRDFAETVMTQLENHLPGARL
jgi:EpsI family protein